MSTTENARRLPAVGGPLEGHRLKGPLDWGKPFVATLATPGGEYVLNAARNAWLFVSLQDDSGEALEREVFRRTLAAERDITEREAKDRALGGLLRASPIAWPDWADAVAVDANGKVWAFAPAFIALNSAGRWQPTSQVRMEMITRLPLDVGPEIAKHLCVVRSAAAANVPPPETAHFQAAAEEIYGPGSYGGSDYGAPSHLGRSG